jgi:hypothetical protein
VLKVDVKTEVEEDRDQLENEVRVFFLILQFLILKNYIQQLFLSYVFFFLQYFKFL